MVKNMRIWLIAFAVVLIYFYALDHFIMGVQGLPLNMNLNPSQ